METDSVRFSYPICSGCTYVTRFIRNMFRKMLTGVRNARRKRDSNAFPVARTFTQAYMTPATIVGVGVHCELGFVFRSIHIGENRLL